MAMKRREIFRGEKETLEKFSLVFGYLVCKRQIITLMISLL
jgi:hypothetical protein